MYNSDQLIDKVLDGSSPEELVEEIVEFLRGTFRRPRKRRFGKKGAAFNPFTGKRKDPTKRRLARKAAKMHRAKRRAASRKFRISSRGKGMYKKLGKLVARIRRR